MARIQINVDPGEIEDFRQMAGDDHFERSILDVAVGHVESAFRRALGDRLLAFRLTGHGRIGWQQKWLDDHKKTVRTALSQGVIRVTWIRPVIDVPSDEPEDFLFDQDPDVMALPAAARIEAVHPMAPLTVKTKIMRGKKRMTFSHLAVTLPVSAFPWADVDVGACSCPEHAITPRLQGPAPTYVCAICGKRSWCACMTDIIEKMRVRPEYNTDDINRLVREVDGPREGACHLCRGVPVTSAYDLGKTGVQDLMLRYMTYRLMEAIGNGGDWKAAENRVRERLSIPRIGEGWVAEIMLLRRVERLFPAEEIIHQGSPDWLGRQRFDIWMPGRSVAIEYNGQQHYRPISLFGGEEAFKRTQERDMQKRRLCIENGARLIEISHYDVIDDTTLHSLITAP